MNVGLIVICFMISIYCMAFLLERYFEFRDNQKPKVMPKVEERYRTNSDNPFDVHYVIIEDVKDIWIKYRFENTGHRITNSMKVKRFLETYELDKEAK